MKIFTSIIFKASICLLLLACFQISNADNSYVGTIPASFNVSPSGAATYSVPIDVPDGIGNLKPTLAITYSSQAGNGILGYGCNLSGISVITRSPKNIYYDGQASGIDYDDDDAFMLDGQRLIKTSQTVNGGVVYYPETDPTTRVIKFSNRFLVQTKDGIRHTFGSTDNSRLTSSRRIASWYIDSVIDLSGNYMLYYYMTNNYAKYISNITYGKNLTQNTSGRNPYNLLINIVRFSYETRPDIIPFHIQSQECSYAYRLKRITCEKSCPIFITRLHYYELNYNDSTDAFSRLTSVYKTADDGNSIKPIKLTWKYLPGFHQEGITPTVVNAPVYPTVAIGDQNYMAADLNGDGLADLISNFQHKEYYNASSYSIKAYVYIRWASLDTQGNVQFSTGKRYSVDPNFSIADWTNSSCGNSVIDFNGDGLNELLLAKYEKIDMRDFKMADIKRIYFQIIGQNFEKTLTYQDNSFTSAPLYAFGDIDKNGLGDIVLVNKTNNSWIKIIKYNREKSDVELTTCNISFPSTPQKIFVSDFNGNGMNDIMVLYSGGYTIFWNQGGGISTTTFSDRYKTVGTSFGNCELVRLGDFNGDGLPDFLYNNINNGLYFFALNAGSGVFTIKTALSLGLFEQSFTTHDDDKFTCLVYDFNHDGKSDVVINKSMYEKYRINLFRRGTRLRKNYTFWLKSTGTGLAAVASASSTNEQDGYSKYFTLGDFNGDGQLELMNYGYNCFTGASGTAWHLYANPHYSIADGKVVSFKDPLGNYTKVTYASLAADDFYTKGSAGSYPVYDIQPALAAVKAVKNEYTYNPAMGVYNFDQNEISGSSASNVRGLNITLGTTTDYTYAGARIHACGKGFLGFTRVQAYNEDTKQKSMTNYGYNTTYYFPYVKSRYNYYCAESINTSGSLISSVVNNYTFKSISGKRFIPYVSEQICTNALKGITITNNIKSIDNYGNIIQTLKTTSDNNSEQNTIFYNNTVNNGNWLIGVPSYINKYRQNSQGNTWIDFQRPIYNTKGQLTQKINYTNNGMIYKVSQENYTYDGFGNVLTSTVKPYSSSASYTTTYTYSTNGRYLTKVTDPMGLTKQYTYYHKGYLKTSKNELGLTTTYVYDGLGRLIKQTNPDGTVTQTSLAWQSLNNGRAVYTKTVTQTGQPTVTTTYDYNNHELQTDQTCFDGTTLHTKKAYDNLGRMTKSSLPYKSSTVQYNVYSYDNYNRPTSIAYASGKIDTWSYSGNSVTSVIDGISKTTVKDATGQVVSVTDPGGTVTYSYRPDGQPDTLTAAGVHTVFTYDECGRKTAIHDPSAGTETYTYDARGNLATKTDARGNVTTMTYDDYNRMTRKATPEMTTTYGYNSNGQLTSVSSTNNTSITYTYDALGRMATEKQTVPDSKWLKKAYSYADGHTSAVAYTSQDGSIATENYTYAHGCLTEIKLNNTTSIWKLTAENDMGQPVGATTGGLTRTYGYDSYGMPTEREVTYGSTVIQHFGYSFDPATGNLSSRTDLTRNMQENFAYDNLNRLTGFGGNTVTYAANGNITDRSEIGGFGYGNSAKPYQVTGMTPYGTAIPLRDQNIVYNSMKRPSTLTENGYTAALAYNDAGDRVKMSLTHNGTTQLTRYYVGGQYETETNTAGSRQKLYLGGDAYSAPAVYVKNNSGNWNIYYICRDYQGSITHVTDASGAVVQELSYDPWGRLRNPATQTVYVTGSEPTPYLGRGYTGHEHLTWFGLINMNARLYDPALGRFLSPDPFVQAPDNTQNFNRYSYCLNNPLIYTDPTGEYAIIDDIIAAAVGGVINLATNAIQGNLSGHGFWGGVGRGFAAFGAGAVGGVGALYPEFGGWVWGGATVGATNAWLGGATSAKDIAMGAGVGAIAGVAGGAAGQWAVSTASPLLSSISSPVLRGAATGVVGGAVGGYAGGFTGGLIMTGDLGAANSAGLNGMWMGAGIGGVAGAGYGYKYSVENNINPWNGKSNTVETPYQTPQAKGQAGVKRAIQEEVINKGGTVLMREVTLEVNGVRVRVDIAADFNGEITLIEVKNGPSAGFTPNQKIVYPKMQDGIPIIPRGANAGYVWGPNQIGQPTTYYVLKIIHY